MHQDHICMYKCTVLLREIAVQLNSFTCHQLQIEIILYMLDLYLCLQSYDILTKSVQMEFGEVVNSTFSFFLEHNWNGFSVREIKQELIWKRLKREIGSFLRK